MAGEAAQAFLTIQAMQSVFQKFDSTVKFGASMCPLDTPIETITSIRRFHYIIIGAGTAGSVLASRLSECPCVSVLLIEAGGCPPIESIFPAYFSYIPATKSDYNILAVNNNYSCQNLQDKAARITIGKMLGGSSSLQHMILVRGDQKSYDDLAAEINCTSWTYDNLLPYFKKSENVQDTKILEEYNYYHGTKGNSTLKKQPASPESDEIIKSYSQLGYKIRIDINNNNINGVTYPLFQIDNMYRQGGVRSYLRLAKNRPNLFVLSGATVTKILFNKQKMATGVQFTYNEHSYVVNSINEVIVSAGAIKTPQLLMLSGIGPADHLNSMKIPVISNLPVGKNLQDHTSVIMLFSLENNTSPSPYVDPTKFPGSLTVNSINLDNKTAKYAQCQALNLVIPQNSSGLMALCLNAFKYNVRICQKWYDANVGNKIMWSYNTAYELLSKGYIKLKTTDINDDPLVDVGYLSNQSDIIKLGRCLANTARVLKTSYFRKIKSQFKDLGLCLNEKKNNVKFWECYSRAMSTPTWHFCGTAAMGSVVDSNLLVKGVKGLRVVDASVLSKIPNAKMNGPVLAVAEKAADLIRASHKISNCHKN